MQVKSLSSLLKRGDWVLEKRISHNGDTSYALCAINRVRHEEAIQELPNDLVEVLVKGGANVVESTGWDD